MTEVTWTNDQVIALLEEYKKLPILWDKDHTKYRDHVAKYEAWCQIAETFQREVYDVKKKFNSIFASHRREKGRVRRGLSTNWFLYDYLNFLPHHLDCEDDFNVKKKRRKRKHIEEEVEEEEEIVDQEDEEELEEDSEEDGHESPVTIVIKEETATGRKTKFAKPKSPPKKLLKRRMVDDIHIVPERRRIINRKICKRPEVYNGKKKDECESFGEYIAISLKKHDERTRSLIKQAINNILFEQEMNKYNNTSQYVVLNSVENPLDEECED